MIPLIKHQNRIAELDVLISNSNIWNDKNASSLLKERKKLFDLLEKINLFSEQISFYQQCYQLMPNDLESLTDQLQKLEQQISDFEFIQMFSDPVDNTPAILSINSGAGGLEAANWCNILLRMYCRYAANNNFKIEILDDNPSEQYSAICKDSVSVKIEGPYAYGLLKGETGVHRLIRNSPFNANNARHTSFAAVQVIPDIEDKIEVKIEDKDIEITAQTAGTKGGQNANRRHTAIRVRHFPTGINIIIRTERDQLSNKRTALKMLKSQLYSLELNKKEECKKEKLNTLTSTSFGHQIRSYIESPQALVKDHRTDCQNNNFSNVLDGDLETFIQSFLRWNK